MNAQSPIAADIPKPEEIIGSRIIIQAASGGGKTYAIRRILEQTHGSIQHLVLDVEDELFTLRERFDYVLVGGDNGDVPITEASAGAMALKLLELGVSAIIQLNDLGLEGQRRMIAAFIGGLMAAPRELWHPVLVTLDEAHRYCPNPKVATASTEALTNLATAGRKRGYGAIFATQRLSQLSTDVRGQCPNRVMGRVDQALDRRAAADLLGFGASSEEAMGLMQLEHQFWVVGPAFGPEPRLHRFSPAVTTHLQVGRRDVPTPPTPGRVKALLGALAGSAAAKQEGSAPAGRAPTAPVTGDPSGSESAIYERGYSVGVADGTAAADTLCFALGSRLSRFRGELSDAITTFDRAIEAALKQLEEEHFNEAKAVQRLSEGRGPRAREAFDKLRRRVSAGVARAGGKPLEIVEVDPSAGIPYESPPCEAPAALGGSHQKVLDALAWFEAARIPVPARVQVGWAAGYRADTGHFSNILSDLAGQGLIDRPSPRRFRLTEAGRARAEVPKGKLTAAVLIDRIKAKIGGPAARVLDALVAAYPSSAARAELADATGYRADTGHFSNILSELTGPGIATRPGPGQLRLADWVMLK